MKIKLGKIWADPVWSKVISAIIIFIGSSLYPLIDSLISTQAFIYLLIDFWTLKLDLWMIFIALFLILLVYAFKVKINSRSIKKYFGTYEVHHYAPHTTGNPKLAKSYLYIGFNKVQYVHKLFECEEGKIEQIDGHLFINLKNQEQQNAPYYFVVKCINNGKIEELAGMALGIGQNQNSHPIAVKLVLRKIADEDSFSIKNYRKFCKIEELPKDEIEQKPYNDVIKLLWNSCGDKDILF